MKMSSRYILDTEVSKQYPLVITYDMEVAFDYGGVTRDMFSAFWEATYNSMFEGSSLLIPLTSFSDTQVFHTIGTILSHGYLVSGHIPVRISLPSLLTIILGPCVDIPSSVLVAAFIDCISTLEQQLVRNALKCTYFEEKARADLISLFSRFGCCEIPTPMNLRKIIIESAKYEFLHKPAAASVMIHFGIPDDHKGFWKNLGTGGICNLYSLLSVTSEKVIDCLECSEFSNCMEEKVFNYLKTMIGNILRDDLRNFLRFVTGSSVITPRNITVIFNSTTGFSRSPFAHTCSQTLELPITYKNYSDFYSEWMAILNNENWRMDIV